MNVTFVNCVPYPLSNQMHPKIHSVMIFLVYFLIPLAIISVYYYHIARTLIKSAHDMPGEVSEHTRRQVSGRRRQEVQLELWSSETEEPLASCSTCLEKILLKSLISTSRTNVFH